MLSEIILGLLISLIYDSLKSGAKMAYSGFIKKIVKQGGNIPKSEMDQLYSLYETMFNNLQNNMDNRFEKMETLIYTIRNQLIDEMQKEKVMVNINLGDIDEKLLESLVHKYISTINDKADKADLRKMKLHLEKADFCFDDGNYDIAIKEYQNARQYVSDDRDEYPILWRIFLCYLNIKNYYVSLYEINGKVVDIQLLINNSDGSLYSAAISLRNLTKISYNQANDILLCATSGSNKYQHLQRFAVSKKGYEIGLNAIEKAKKFIDTKEMEDIYSILYYID